MSRPKPGKDAAARLRAARQKLFRYAGDAALTHGWPEQTYRSHENGSRGFDLQTAKAYGAAFGVRWEWLVDGQIPETDVADLPTVAPVGAVNLDRLRAALLEAQLSARAASIRAGSSPDFVRTILRGKSQEPGIIRLRALADVLGVPVENLLRSQAEMQFWRHQPDVLNVVVPAQKAITVRADGVGEVVIAASGGPGDDQTISVRREHLDPLIAALQRAKGAGA